MSNGGRDRIRYAPHADEPPFELVRIEDAQQGYCPEPFRSRVVVDTVHDGALLPNRLLVSPVVSRLHEEGMLWETFVQERDWGANLVAENIARYLGLNGYYRVNTARLAIDFNRFPGSSPPDTSLFNRLAINEPFSSCLTHQQKLRLLDDHYDTISTGMEQSIIGSLLKVSIHTYDERNDTDTERPEISLLTSSYSYQQSSRLPYNTFAPIFPDVIAECTAKRIFRDRLALTLAKAGVRVAHNYPYCLPDGSIEVRAQPWLFFQHLRELFEVRHPDTRENPAFGMVWRMLLNTNLRDHEAAVLSAFLFRYRRPPVTHEDALNAARAAYETVSNFLEDRPQLVTNYLRSPARSSAISIEVRKDLVWRFDGDEPVGAIEDNARQIGAVIAEAIAAYLREDLVEAR